MMNDDMFLFKTDKKFLKNKKVNNERNVIAIRI